MCVSVCLSASTESGVADLHIQIQKIVHDTLSSAMKTSCEKNDRVFVKIFMCVYVREKNGSYTTNHSFP